MSSRCRFLGFVDRNGIAVVEAAEALWLESKRPVFVTVECNGDLTTFRLDLCGEHPVVDADALVIAGKDYPVVIRKRAIGSVSTKHHLVRCDAV